MMFSGRLKPNNLRETQCSLLVPSRLRGREITNEEKQAVKTLRQPVGKKPEK
jgi:hypothetical protein